MVTCNALIVFRIENYTPDMTVAEVDDVIERSLQVWAKVTPLRFTRIYSGTADIMVSFGSRGKHYIMYYILNAMSGIKLDSFQDSKMLN